MFQRPAENHCLVKPFTKDFLSTIKFDSHQNFLQTMESCQRSTAQHYHSPMVPTNVFLNLLSMPMYFTTISFPPSDFLYLDQDCYSDIACGPLIFPQQMGCLPQFSRASVYCTHLSQFLWTWFTCMGVQYVRSSSAFPVVTLLNRACVKPNKKQALLCQI